MPSIEKITEAVGWRPTIDLDSILAEVVTYEGARITSQPRSISAERKR
jgi:hypothetical protein